MLNGCTTQVHLITQGYTLEQTNEISNKITNAGFKVIPTSIGIPPHYPQSVLALNPAHSAPQDVPTIQRILTSLYQLH